LALTCESTYGSIIPHSLTMRVIHLSGLIDMFPFLHPD
jgi:hypothetical protein